MKTYTACVIGAGGSIGGLKPSKYDSPESDNILTHCHALCKHPRTALSMIIDKDLPKAGMAAGKWGTRYCATLDTAFVGENLDIAIVATPTETHRDVLLELLEREPHLVIAEKPFCDNSTQAKEVIDAYKAANIPLMVNYTRRFVPEIQWIRDMIRSQELGAVQGCRIIYNRGLKREASHAIDLCNWFFGDCTRGRIAEVDVRHLLTDYSHDDPTYAVYLEYANCPHVFFSPADGRHFSIFEVDILLEGGRITLIEYGLKYNLYSTKPEPTYGDYLTLSYEGKTFETGLNRALLSLVDNAVDHLDTGKPLLCGAEEALRVHEVLERLI